MPAGERRKPPTNHGRIKPVARKQLQTVLEHFVDVLESETLVFSHNLGVHSGTAVMEDLVARKLWELCNRAHTLVTMNDNCMDTFLKFCESLTADKRSRMFTAFDVFDKGDLLDYVQLVKPDLLRDSIMKHVSSSQQHTTDSWTSAAGKTQSVAADGATPRVQQQIQAAAPFVSRVEALRNAGHPFLKIVDKLIEDKRTHREPTQNTTGGTDDVIGALRDGVVTEELAEQVHRMLKSNLTARKKWLAGIPLHLALLENPSPPAVGAPF